MAIFIDTPMSHNPKYRGWCHMMTDSNDLQELHDFASRLGLKRDWFQPKSHPHYDLSPAKQKLALSLGALRVTPKQLVLLCVFKRDTDSNLESREV